MQKQRGFTFVELLVTVAILALLTAITAISFRGANKNARDTRRKAELQEIKGAIEEYRLANGMYPAVSDTSMDGVFLLDLQPDYLGRNYVDPTSDSTHYYEYRYVGAPGCSYALFSLMENPENAQGCPAPCSISTNDIYCLSE